MKVDRAKKTELAKKLKEIATNVAKKPVFVIDISAEGYNVLNYYTKQVVLQQIPSKTLAGFICDSINRTKRQLQFSTVQHYINVYSKHYYDCEFYRHTIKTTKDPFKKSVTITRLDVSIEYLKAAASYIRKSC